MNEPKKFDAAEYLDTPELISAYLIEAMDDPILMIRAIRTVERALEMWVPPKR